MHLRPPRRSELRLIHIHESRPKHIAEPKQIAPQTKHLQTSIYIDICMRIYIYYIIYLCEGKNSIVYNSLPQPKKETSKQTSKQKNMNNPASLECDDGPPKKHLSSLPKCHVLLPSSPRNAPTHLLPPGPTTPSPSTPTSNPSPCTWLSKTHILTRPRPPRSAPAAPVRPLRAARPSATRPERRPWRRRTWQQKQQGRTGPGCGTRRFGLIR